MPGGKPPKRPVSKAQARFMGAAAGGEIPGYKPADAKNDLRGVDTSKLPKKSKGGKK